MDTLVRVGPNRVGVRVDKSLTQLLGVQEDREFLEYWVPSSIDLSGIPYGSLDHTTAVSTFDLPMAKDQARR